MSPRIAVASSAEARTPAMVGAKPLATEHRMQWLQTGGVEPFSGWWPAGPLPHQPVTASEPCPAEAAASEAGISALISSARMASQATPRRRFCILVAAVICEGSLRQQVLDL